MPRTPLPLSKSLGSFFLSQWVMFTLGQMVRLQKCGANNTQGAQPDHKKPELPDEAANTLIDVKGVLKCCERTGGLGLYMGVPYPSTPFL